MDEKELRELESILNKCKTLTVMICGKTFNLDLNGCMIDVIGDEQALIHLNVHCDEEETRLITKNFTTLYTESCLQR